MAGLIESCPELRIVTTSRTPLRIAAEREYALDPLELPPPSDPASTESLGSYPAIALFVERAKMTRGSFELTPENAGAVAAVCRRLDGLPLALELAAARLRLLAPEALLERLDHALQVLTSGARDVPERQQTLRATIDWSHSLLEDAEQRLFRRLAVFAGGCTFADVEAVCADPGETILDELESLVDKALVQTDGQGDRLRMLQTIGEYARERLEAAGETRRARAEARSPVCGARTDDPRRHRGHRSDRFPRTRPRRGGEPPGRARHAPGDGEGRRRGCLRGGPADVRRPMALLAHPRQEPHRPGIRHVLPRRRHRWRLRRWGGRAR